MPRPKILIVDDEPFNVDFLEQELDDLGYDTVAAVNGQEALDRVRTESPDLVLLDIMMPIMDGFTVLGRLKADAATQDIPVIIISAMTDLQSVVKGIQAGADDYLPKPFEPVVLRARISTGLDRKLRRDRELEYLRQVECLTAAAQSVASEVRRQRSAEMPVASVTLTRGVSSPHESSNVPSPFTCVECARMPPGYCLKRSHCATK